MLILITTLVLSVLIFVQYFRRPKSIVVVLGSGGHTNEMLRMLLLMKPERLADVIFVIGKGDQLSASKALQWSKFTKLNSNIMWMTRPRNIHQTLLKSLPKMIIAAFEALYINVVTRPKIILSNGPAIGLIFCIAGRALGLSVKIIYIESFARVTTLSWTGKYMQYIASKFYVQWPQLKASKGLLKAERRYGTGPLV